MFSCHFHERIFFQQEKKKTLTVLRCYLVHLLHYLGKSSSLVFALQRATYVNVLRIRPFCTLWLIVSYSLMDNLKMIIVWISKKRREIREISSEIEKSEKSAYLKTKTIFPLFPLYLGKIYYEFSLHDPHHGLVHTCTLYTLVPCNPLTLFVDIYWGTTRSKMERSVWSTEKRRSNWYR